jgi:hypothetical protein
VGQIASESLQVTTAMHADFSPPHPGNELKIPITVPIDPTKNALDAIAAKLARPRLIFRQTKAAARSDANFAASMSYLTLF